MSCYCLNVDEASKERYDAKLCNLGLQAFDPYVDDDLWKDDVGDWPSLELVRYTCT